VGRSVVLASLALLAALAIALVLIGPADAVKGPRAHPADAVLEAYTPQAIVMHPGPDQRFTPDQKIPIQVLVRHLKHRLSDGAAKATLSGGPDGKLVPLDLNADPKHQFHLVDGWESQFSGEVDAGKLADGYWNLSVETMGAATRPLTTSVQFGIQLPDATLDELAQRAAATADASVDNQLAVAPIGFEDAHATIRAIAPSFVDPATGRRYDTVSPDSSGLVNLLNQVLGRSNWLPPSAAYQDRLDEIHKVLQALSWQSATPRTEATSVAKQASQTVDNNDQTPCNQQAAQLAPSLYASARAATPVAVERSYAGVSLQSSGNSYSLSIARDIWAVDMTTESRKVTLTAPVDEARLFTTSTSPYFSNPPPMSETVMVKGQDAAWKPGPGDWDGGAGAIKVGNTTPVGSSETVVDWFPVPVGAVTAPDSTPTRPRLVDYLAVVSAEPDPPPGFPPAPSDMSGCRWLKLATVLPQLIFHQAFPTPAPTAPFPVISPSSLDGRNSDLGDVGALDFANQAVGGRSDPQRATITNSGGRALVINRITMPTEQFEQKNDCEGRTLKTDESCHIDVTIAPTAREIINAGAQIEISDNAAGGKQTIALNAVGSPRLHAPGTVDESQGLPYRVDCAKLKLFGWHLIADPPRELAGEVVTSHIAAEDFSANHQNVDFNWFVYPDPDFRLLLSSPGNWHTGDRYEAGRVEVEWERHSPRWAGLPEWAWPTQGDRTYMVGNHVYDCGHQDEGHRSEIHPPQFLATYRNAALSRLAVRGPLADVDGRVGSYEPEGETAATRVDMYASSFGGDALDSERGTGWYQAVDDFDYQFVVLAPPKPVRGSQLTMWSKKMTDLRVGEEPIIQPLGDRGYLVTLPLTRARKGHRREEMASGWRFLAGWKGDNVPKAKVRRFHVEFNSIHIREAITGKWSMHLYAADEGRGSVLTGDGENANNEKYKEVEDGDTVDLKHGNSFDVELLPGQPLRVAARAESWRSFGASAFLGAAEKIYPDPGPVTDTVRLDAGPNLAVGFEDDVDKKCRAPNKPCFSITVSVSRR
jgi:hypothetical protein